MTDMTTSPENPAYDVWVDFNDIYHDDHGDSCVDACAADVAYVAGLPVAAGFAVGEKVTAGDGEGNTCPAVVTKVAGMRFVLKLDIDKFQLAVAPPPEGGGNG
jgi:hypothetical protein